MNIGLVFPRTKYGEHSPPLGLGYIAAVLEQRGYAPQLIDLTFDKDMGVWEEYVRRTKPDVVGITCQTTFAEQAFQAARSCKELSSKTRVVIGGPHPTVMPEETLAQSGADMVVAGEGEYAFADIVAAIEKGEDPYRVAGVYSRTDTSVVYGGRRSFIADLDEIPFPARHLFDRRYLNFPEATMISSRGCPFRCAFCQPTLEKLFGKKVRLRSPENVLAEIAAILTGYGNKTIRFHDDTFTWNRSWVERFCRLIEERGLRFQWNCKSRIDVLDRELIKQLRQAGCTRLDLGVESGSSRILDEVLRKGISLEKIRDVFRMCREEGLPALAFIMVGNPTETPQEVSATIGLLEELPASGVHVSLFTPFPGTAAYDFAREKGLIAARSWAEYDFYSCVSLSSEFFTSVQIKRMKVIVDKGIRAVWFFKSTRGLAGFCLRHPRTVLLMAGDWLRLAVLKAWLRRQARRTRREV